MRNRRKISRGRRPGTKPRWISLVRVVLSAILVSVLLILLTAFFLKQGWMPLSALTVSDLAIKTLCGALCGYLAAKCFGDERTLLMALISAASYLLLSLLSFGLIERVVPFGWNTLLDLVLVEAAALACCYLRMLLMQQRQKHAS